MQWLTYEFPRQIWRTENGNDYGHFIYCRFTITLAWFDLKLCFDTLLNIFDSLPNQEFDFIKTTFGGTTYRFDLTFALVLTIRLSHLISYEFDLVSDEYDLASYKFDLTSREFLTPCKFDLISYEYVLTSSQFGLTIHEFDVTSDDFELKMA